MHAVDPAGRETLESIFAGARWLGQGNPRVTEHPMSPDECRARRAGLPDPDPEDARICGGPNMAPLFDPVREERRSAEVCIDRFEFPNVACSYPVTWVRAREAALICQALGKRICDAHEWEGACAGALRPPDYRFELAQGVAPPVGVERMRQAHNQAHETQKRWSYGPAYQTGICAAASRKSPGCTGGSFALCGTNTYPAGAFPDCASPFGVFDLHGNAAEHMNLPLAPNQMSSRGQTLGVTEMKGSWFIFDHYKAHEDHCRWRAPYWHGGPVMAPDSHHNYHLGFRCCRSISRAPDSP